MYFILILLIAFLNTGCKHHKHNKKEVVSQTEIKDPFVPISPQMPVEMFQEEDLESFEVKEDEEVKGWFWS